MASTFRYSGVDARGQRRNGRIVAASRQVALQRMVRRGIEVKRLRRQWAKEALRNDFGGLRRRMPLKDISWIFRNLASMVRSGLILPAACELLADQRPGTRVGHLMATLQADLEAGIGVGEVFATHGRHIGAVPVSMVQAGEAAGALHSAFLSIASLCDAEARLRKNIRRSISYPLTVLVTCGGLVAAMVYFLVPRFQESYDEMDIELPSLTRTVVDLSATLVRQGWTVPVGVLVIVALVMVIRQLPAGRWATDNILLHTPRIGSIMNRAVTARSAKTLGELLSSKVPMLDALDLAGAAAGNAVIARSFADIRDAIAQGDSVSMAFSSAHDLPLVLRDLAAVGDATADVGGVMLRYVASIEDDLKADGEGFGKSLEPILVVVLGVMVGVVVIALYLPMFEIASKVK